MGEPYIIKNEDYNWRTQERQHVTYPSPEIRWEAERDLTELPPGYLIVVRDIDSHSLKVNVKVEKPTPMRIDFEDIDSYSDSDG